MTLHCLQHNYEHGLCAKHMCATKFLGIIEDLTNPIDKSNPIDAIYLDLEKAVDSVLHE